jgi:membrane-bound lytic murein transglycosylase D
MARYAPIASARSVPRRSAAAASAALLALALCGLAGCAHVGGSEPAPQPVAAPEAPLTSEGPATTHDLSDAGDDLDAIPLEVNRLVLQWIDYFQGRGREHMERYLSRSTRYVPLMKGILKKEGLPEDLVYIALIESGFSPQARSSASAVGFWQFIRGTGKRYGLEINSYVDERRDFARSTSAAADYFKGLYNLFGSWYLAIASYNVGENRVKNVVMKYHTRDFWALARDGKLPSETINYVPKFLAARLIAKAPEKYGFAEVEYQPPLSFAEVELASSVDLRKLAAGMGADYDDLRDLNPAFKRGVAFDRNGKLRLRVPVELKDKAAGAAAGAVAGNPRSYASTSDDDVATYRVRRGDTLGSIARRFGTSSRHLRTLNKGKLRLVAGHKIKVPGDSLSGLAMEELSPGKGGFQGSSAKKNSRIPQGARIHIVRKGDTLAQIAQRYQVSLAELARRNALRRKSRIAAGTKLEIPE